MMCFLVRGVGACHAPERSDVTSGVPGWQTGGVPQQWPPRRPERRPQSRPQRQWINKSQPQTLQGAVLFSYLNAALAVLFALFAGRSYVLVIFVLLAVAAYGIANERKVGYWGGVVLACLYLFYELVLLVTGGGFGYIIDLLFAGVLVALLLHPESRHYQRIWFH